MRALSARERDVAEAFALDGLRCKQIAARLGLTEETVRSYLKRLRQKYRESGVDAGSQHLLRAVLLREAAVTAHLPVTSVSDATEA